MFISFEGVDYSGKSTQAQLLVKRFQKAGKEALFLREPGGTAVSEKIRTILLEKSRIDIAQKTELFLFSAARCQLVNEVILKALKSGKAIVCDRFFDSTTAYQGYGRGLDLQEIAAVNRIATSGTKPDLTVLVDIEVAEIERRRKAAGLAEDRMESAGDHFYDRVRSGYHAIAKAEPSRFVTVDGMRPPEVIHEEIWNIITQRFQ
ncbi:MAG TPA: dTMP kinase [Bacteroidota bacterium]|nr:dTMP kinase [Bacteroidota bacterium]